MISQAAVAMHKDLEELAARASTRRMGEGDIALLHNVLSDQGRADDWYDALHLIGKHGVTALRGDVERFLELGYGGDFNAAKALWVLIDQWGETAQYRAQIVKGLRLSWGESLDFKGQAIFSAGSAILQKEDPELVQLLLDIGLGSEGADQKAADFALILLRRFLKPAWKSETPRRSYGDALDDEEKASTIAAVRQFLGRGRSH